jgi:hypothetical protein
MTDRVGAGVSGVREGYPTIDDPSHALWEAQAAGWPDHLPHEAWAAVVAAAPVGGFASSGGHPAFDEAYLGNPHASQPEEVTVRPLLPVKDRR